MVSSLRSGDTSLTDAIQRQKMGFVERLQRFDEPLPRHQRLHLGQEALAAGYLLLVLVLCLGERDLLHRMARSGGDRVARFYPADGCQAAVAGFMQCFPRDLLHPVK